MPAKPRTLLLNALVFLLLAALMWAASLWLYDGKKTQEALEWRDAVLAARTPFSWPFESPDEIGVGHGVEDFEWNGQTLAGDSDDPYFFLNLRGRFVDAKRYTILKLRLYSEDEDHLRLFHQQQDDREIHFSEEIAVSPGWQSLRLDLRALNWQRRDIRPQFPEGSPSAWGSPGGLVTALRIDPVRSGAFQVGSIDLLERLPEPPGSAAIEPFRDLDDPLFDAVRNDPESTRFVAQDRWWRTPETAHRTRMRIAAEFPSLVVFPRPVRAADLAAAPVPPGRWPVALFIAALFLNLCAGLLPERRRAATEALSFLVMLSSAVFLAGRLDGGLFVLPALALMLVAWQMKPDDARGCLGATRAWRLLAPLMLLALAVILLLPQRGPQDSPLWQVLLFYLGWALAQQFIVAELIFGRLQRVWADGAVVLAAGAFAFLHFPNFALMMGTFLMGLCLLGVYRRHRDLPAVAATHALLAVAVNQAAPYALWLSREIGPRYLQAL